MKKDSWKDDLYLYRLTPAPKKENFQEYMDLYFSEKDEKYLNWFLHYYEPILNTRAMNTVQEYSMRGHFVDLKQAAVFGILKALANYDVSLGLPFLVYKEHYVKNEVDEYIRTMRTGYTVQSSDEYKLLRKAMALYNKYRKADDETISHIAAEIGKSVKDIKEIIAAGLRNMSYAEFYRQYADEDGESSAEDITRDDTTDPAKVFFDEWRADAVFDRYEKLDIRERSMIAEHLGFCRVCHGILENSTDENGDPVLLFREKKAYADLALQHTLSSPDTAYRIVHKAYDKILIELAIDEYIHTSDRNPLFDVMFAYQSEQMTGVVFGDEKAELLPIPVTTSKYDFTLNIMPRENDVVIMAEYCTDLYKEQTIHRLIGGYKLLLKQMLMSE